MYHIKWQTFGLAWYKSTPPTRVIDLPCLLVQYTCTSVLLQMYANLLVQGAMTGFGSYANWQCGDQFYGWELYSSAVQVCIVVLLAAWSLEADRYL